MDAESGARPVKGKVLVVDDEELICHSLRLGLEKHGYSVVTTQKATEALEKIEHEAFDVVLTDIRMPGMDGIQMLKAIRQSNPQLAVIFITGYPSVETSAKALGLGAEAYITKPFHKVDKILIPIESAIAKVKQKKKTKPVTEAKQEKIECVDCHCEFLVNNWKPGTPCPACGSKNTFPLPPSSDDHSVYQDVTGALNSWRFGRIARWADLIDSAQLIECLTVQWELTKNAEPVPPLGSIMLKKRYLNSREVKAVLKAQVIKRPTEEEARFGRIAIYNKFITKDQLERCLNIQVRMMLYQAQAPHLGEILLEKGYVSEPQIKRILKFQQQNEQKGLLEYLRIESVTPFKRFKRKLVATWQAYPSLRFCTLGTSLLILLLVSFSTIAGRASLLRDGIVVIDDSGTTHRVVSTELSTIPKKSGEGLFYALYCKKCGVYFPLKIYSEPEGNLTLQSCPRCGRLEDVNIPAGVEEVIER